jgi:proline iminopeptidase
MLTKILEGYMPFKGHNTYYRIVGENKNNGKKPLVLLHGGPGSSHNYFEVLDKLAEIDGRQIIMYDQIGCGNSFVENRPDLWKSETWVEELQALREHLNLGEVHILGQSWGGMLLLDYVCNYKPRGVKSLILSSTLPASWMWGIEQHRMIKELPADMQAAIEKAASEGKYDKPEYQQAEDEYMLRHCFGPSKDTPECVTRPKKSGRESYVVAWGPNEYTPLGTLKDYDVTEQLKDIKEPALMMSGGNDMSTPYINKYMLDRIPDSQWELFRTSRHMPFVEAADEYISVLIKFLNAND